MLNVTGAKESISSQFVTSPPLLHNGKSEKEQQSGLPFYHSSRHKTASPSIRPRIHS